MNGSPFDHRQDRELGDALRTALTGRDEPAFVHAVVASAALLQDRGYDDADWWEVLSGWARPGLAAAAIGLAAVAALRMGVAGAAPDAVPELVDPLQAAAEIPAAFLAAQAPDLNEVLALELGNWGN
jgi:hypothetical protein